MTTPAERMPRPWERPELIPLLPLVLAAWEDGILTDTEVEHLRDGVLELGLLSAPAQAELLRWTDPHAPPAPSELAALSRWVRSSFAGRQGPASPATLTDLGLTLADGESEARHGLDADSVRELRELESAMGILGGEAVRRILDVSAGHPSTGADAPAFDPRALRAFLDRDDRLIRDRVLELLPRPELALPEGLPLESYRGKVLEAVRFLAAEGLGSLGYPEEHGGAGDPAGSVAVFETLALGDLSVLVKFGVQFGLFGGSIYQLGTAPHHELLAAVGSLELPGCYAMTETGHGSNVRELETTATYDPASRELVIHSPTESSGKDWIGNAARDGRMATVFARLLVEGDDHGVHAILVPLRDQRGALLPGIRIEDRGRKLGLNGVDNGRIWFHRVRVPAANLLDRFATIDEDGTYRSPIPGSGRRFFTMLGTLVAGRVSIASASVSAAKVGLTIALRYAARRTQFGPAGGEEVPLLTYRTVQSALIPPLASTYALHFAVRDLQRRFGAASSGDEDLEVRAAALKAWASDHCVQTLQACREACGGQGYLAENRLGALRADTDVFTTFEGANDVLYQLVAKGLLSRYQETVGDPDLRTAMRWLGEWAETSLTELNPVATRRTDVDHLLDPSFHAAALRYREERLLRSVALRLRARLRDGMDSFQAVNEVQDHLVATARAWTERIVLEAFHEGIAAAPPGPAREVLQRLAALFALARIEADRAWFLEAGYLERSKSRAIRAQVAALAEQVAGDAVALCDSFAIPDALLPDLVRPRDPS